MSGDNEHWSLKLVTTQGGLLSLAWPLPVFFMQALSIKAYALITAQRLSRALIRMRPRY